MPLLGFVAANGRAIPNVITDLFPVRNGISDEERRQKQPSPVSNRRHKLAG